MKKAIIYLCMLSFFFVNDLFAQTSLNEIQFKRELSVKLSEQINEFKDELNPGLVWEFSQAGYLLYNKNNRYEETLDEGIEVISMKTMVMGRDLFRNRLRTGGTVINVNGKLCILNGVHRDILVFIDFNACCGGESLEISLYNEELKMLCSYDESGEELSEKGNRIYKLIFEKPHEVIKWFSSSKCGFE